VARDGGERGCGAAEVLEEIDRGEW
jgi:hypothetical protein